MTVLGSCLHSNKTLKSKYPGLYKIYDAIVNKLPELKLHIDMFFFDSTKKLTDKNLLRIHIYLNEDAIIDDGVFDKLPELMKLWLTNSNMKVLFCEWVITTRLKIEPYDDGFILWPGRDEIKTRYIDLRLG